MTNECPINGNVTDEECQECYDFHKRCVAHDRGDI